MTKLENVLIPEKLLALHRDEAIANAIEWWQCSKAAEDEPRVRTPYLNYLVLTYLCQQLPAEWQSEPILLYNRYFWFRRFQKEYCQKHGRDAGIEQQAFQILDWAITEIDWRVIQAIEREASWELLSDSAL